MSDTPEIPQGPLVDDLVDGGATEQRAAEEQRAANEQPATTPAPAPEQRLSRKAAWLAMGAVTLALALIWIAPGIEHVDETAATGGATSGSPGEPEDAAAVGKPARLDFQLKDMNGVDVKLDSFKGKVILLNFWATWCGPCKAEIPSLVELQEKYADDLVVLGFSVDDPAEKIKPYADEYKVNYPLLVGNGREDVQNAFGPLLGIPVSVIIGRDGVIAKKHTGIATKEQFEREIQALL
jgi:cytochrome c biogenesis protein CcmG/thiol:disulfide interchange protein DsbE